MSPVIEADGVSKRYGTVRALEDASFAAVPGEIHALVGENGAGKSTLIKTLCGVTKPDGGTIRAFGEEFRPGGPAAAQARGIGTVFQELTLLPWLTVAENLLIGREPRGALGLIRRREFARRAGELLDEYGVTSVDPSALTADLSLAQRQVIEIVRTVSRKPKVLFLDEPTSSLAEHEVEWLFGLVRRLREAGTCVVFTSHRWHEVAGLSDRITVFRNGGHVATRDTLTEDEAVTLMTGRSLTETGDEKPAPATDTIVLQADDLRGGRLDGVSLTVRAGEILGVGGLEGQGQRDLFLALFGVQRTTGEIRVNGEPVRLRSPRDAAKAGIALVPEDRGGEGLFAPMTVRENLTLPIVDRLAAAGLLRSGAERGPVQKMIERMRITARDPDQPVGTLSGGNQQKVLIGRWLLAEASVLLLYDVTRGVDVATKRDIFALMRDLAADGHAILYYSSDTEEIARLAHRVLVLREGRIAAELTGPGVEPGDIVSAAVREEAPDGDPH